MTQKKISDLNCLTVFIPLNEQYCGVTIMEDLLSEIFNSRLKSIVIGEYSNHISKNLSDYNLDYLKKVILFAHPNKEIFSGLLVNRGLLKDILTENWWKNSQEQAYDIIFANVCMGAKFLSKQQWMNIFPNWISFKNDIYVFIGSKNVKLLYINLYEKIIEIIYKSKSLTDSTEKIKDIFEKTIAQLYDGMNFENGDQLTLLYITQAYQSIITSEDQHG